MLEAIKLACRYRTADFDNEIKGYIQSCKNNLILGGVKEANIKDDDESIRTTVKAYCKWQLDFQGKGERWEKIYKGLKTSLVLDRRYSCTQESI